MNEDLPEEIVAAVKRLIQLLSENQYSEIVAWTQARRLQEPEIEIAITEYGRTVVMPPESFYPEYIDAIRIEHSDSQEWSVVFPLWTLEEGESDLSVEFTFKEGDPAAGPELELDNIHVL